MSTNSCLLKIRANLFSRSAQSLVAKESWGELSSAWLETELTLVTNTAQRLHQANRTHHVCVKWMHVSFIAHLYRHAIRAHTIVVLITGQVWGWFQEEYKILFRIENSIRTSYSFIHSFLVACIPYVFIVIVFIVCNTYREGCELFSNSETYSSLFWPWCAFIEIFVGFLIQNFSSIECWKECSSSGFQIYSQTCV